MAEKPEPTPASDKEAKAKQVNPAAEKKTDVTPDSKQAPLLRKRRSGALLSIVSSPGA